jgi:hypothetical protein
LTEVNKLSKTIPEALAQPLKTLSYSVRMVIARAAKVFL